MAFKSVDEYIAAQPDATRKTLRQVRAAIKKALPKATEGISYQIPIYKIDGKMVLYFAGYAKHWSIYPATDRVLEELGDEIEVHSKATIRFPLDQVPARLIARIAKIRAAEVKAKGRNAG